MENQASIDLQKLDELKELLGDTVNELLIDFKQEIPDYINALTQRHVANDMESVLRHAHNIKSSSGNLGLLQLSALSELLEEAIRGKKSMNYSRLIDQIKEEMESLLLKIDDYISHG